MTIHTSTNDDGTPRSSHLSQSPTVSPAWAPPKAPLPPHRLAKLANALGVSTPVPAVHHNAPFMSRSLLDNPSTVDPLRRSPTPSTVASMAYYSPLVSKHLLHVIPPLHLPHESEEYSHITPPPTNASGYHTQFRRGTLVPVHSTLQAQLAAIAKEYALPSTAGLILYLVSSAKVSSRQDTTLHMEDDEPGPRLCEEIWKHLWTRVMKAEQREDYLLPPSRSHTPNIFNLSNGAKSTPFLPQDGRPLRPFLSIMGSDPHQPQPSQSPFTPSPSTPSTTSDIRSHTKSAPPSSSSISQSEPETPDTSTGSHSFDPDARKDSLDLPGLDSPSIIPILAKVEFDIDRQKATWYDPWLRSRRMNHVKRTESRAGRRSSVNDESSQERLPPVSLVTGNKEASSLILSKGALLLQTVSASAGYESLPEAQDDDDEWSEGDDFDRDEFTASVAMQSSLDRDSKRTTNPNIVPLALDAADLAVLHSSPVSEYEHLGDEEDEVRDLLEQMTHPQVSITNPSSPPSRRSSSPPGPRKHVPPPLVIMPVEGARDLVVPTESSPMPSSAGSTHLAYLSGPSSEEISAGVTGGRLAVEDDEFVTYTRVRSPEEHEKREGAVFADLDLGLDPTEDFDEGDPNDRRRSQYLMKAQLDEIERTMAQLSPRMLNTDLEPQNPLVSAALSSDISLSPGKWNSGFSPKLPRQAEITDNSYASESKPQAAWPAVPFSSLNDSATSSSPARQGGPPSPPRLAVNGVTTSAPTSFVPNFRSSVTEMSSETQMRKRALEEEQSYSGFPPPAIPNSPIIPLSPDPFGRFSSSPSGRSSTYWEDDPPVQSSSSALSSITEDTHNRTRSTSSATTSRFSVDSIAEEIAVKPTNRSTLMTVSTIKRLWRKSGKNVSTSNTPPPPPPPTPTTATGRSSMQVPQRPERPSQEQLELPPTTPTMGRFSPQLAPPRPSQELPPSPRTPVSQATVQAQQLPAPVKLPPQQLPVHPPTHQPRGSQSYSQPHQLSVPQPQQLGVSQPQPRPMQGGRPAHTAPIVAAQMQPSRGSASMDRLHFDQESPYPTRRMPHSPQSNPPPDLPSPSPRFSDLPLPMTPRSAIPPVNAPPAPEKEKPSTRKSILKGWKSGVSSTAQPPPTGEARPSLDRPSTERSSMERQNSGGAARGKRANILNFGSSRSSVVSPPPDIPPNPQIPQQFVNPQRNERRQSIKSKLTSGSVDLSSSSPPRHNGTHGQRPASPQRSTRSSISSRPSFDTSQFEIVSPKMNSTLSYPYHELDHN